MMLKWEISYEADPLKTVSNQKVLFIQSERPEHLNQKVKRAKRKTATEEIEEIIELWKFRLTGQQQGRLATACEVQEETSDDTENEVFKFVRSVDVGDDKHGWVSINDTSIAWTVLRESANHDRRNSLTLERQKESGRFKQLGDVVRFLKRTSKETEMPKAINDRVLPYNDQCIPRWEKHCYICRSSCTERSPLISCRICPRIYHTECLECRGYLSEGLLRETVKLALSEIGWSCFNCENLFDLLTDTEKIDIMETFYRMDTNQDSFVNKEEYLEYQKDCYQKLIGLEMPGYRIRLEERTFADMDRRNLGQIDWWQYQLPMCVRKLADRKRRNLVSYLTKQEVYKLRTFFKEYDQDGYGMISEISAKTVFKKWYLSLINLRPEHVPVWDWLGAEWIRDDEPEEVPFFQRSTTVAWKDFVKDKALYILAARPNTGSVRPYIPRLESYGREFDSDEDENENI